MGQLGDLIGGVIGTIIAGVTVYFVWQTFALQRRELEASKEELKITREHLQKQQFESTYFNMLSMIQNIGNYVSYTEPVVDVDIDERTFTGNYFYKYVVGQLKRYHTSGKKLSIADSILNCHDTGSIREFEMKESIRKQVEQESRTKIPEEQERWVMDHSEEYCGLVYERVFEETGTQLGHFFRYIINAIEFAEEERKKANDAKRYINLIQAQLSNYQLSVMFYNLLSSVSLNAQGEKRAKELVDNYGLLKNIHESHLIDKSHCAFFPKTKFKFLGNRTYGEYSSEVEYTNTPPSKAQITV